MNLPQRASFASVGHNIQVKFVQSLPQCSWTSKLLPPCRSAIHGRQLRNYAKLTQPRACTNRYVSSPIPYYIQLLINSKLPQLVFLLSIFLCACLLPSWASFLCCLLLYLLLCFFGHTSGGGGGGTQMARGGIRLVHGHTKSTLIMYFSCMKIDPKYAFLHAFFLICLSCPFQNLSTWPKTHPFFQLRPVLTKWATSRQGSKGDMAHWTFKKSIENKGISQGNNGFWSPNKAETQAYYISF